VKPELSIVIPVYNEIEALPLCYDRISNVLKNIHTSYEIIFIDDGSKDDSAAYMSELAHKDDTVKVILFSRNFGKEAALSAGIDFASGEALIILDADLQDPPELIPNMLKVWREKDVDAVLMKRTMRAGESATKKQSAFWFYRILNKLSDFHIPEDVGDFRLMNRKSIDALKSLPERNRYTKGLFAWIGMDTYVMEYNRDPRVAGIAKQRYSSLFSLAFEGITSFSIHPLRVATFFGMITAIIGFMFGIYIMAKAIIFGDAVPGYPSMIAIITFLGGVQLLGIGILGEYVGKTYIESKKRPIYLVKKLITKKSQND
jgi:glycosyltransferase involved in cell wall biosynthesis